MKRFGSLLALLLIAGSFPQSVRAAETAIASCGGNYYHPTECDDWFTLPGPGIHSAIARFEAPGEFRTPANGPPLRFGGSLRVDIGIGPGAVHPCPDNPFGFCRIEVDYDDGSPTSQQVYPGRSYPSASADVPFRLQSGTFHFGGICSDGFSTNVPLGWCGEGSDMPGNGPAVQAWRDHWPRDGYFRVTLIVLD